MLELGVEKNSKTLDVKLGEEMFHIPLAASLPIPFVMKFREIAKLPKGEADFASVDVFYELFKAYMGEAVDLLDVEDFSQLCKVWSEAGNENGASLGE